MAAPNPRPKAEPAQAQLPQAFAEAQQQSTAALARANEVLLKTIQAIWEQQVALFRLEAEQATKAMVPPRLGAESESVADYCHLLRDNSEQMITRMRSVNDLMRDCNWQLLEIYAEGVGRNAALARSAETH